MKAAGDTRQPLPFAKTFGFTPKPRYAPPPTYTAVFNLKALGTYVTMKAAFERLYDEIQKAISARTLTEMGLWECSWIEVFTQRAGTHDEVFTPGGRRCIPFHEARDNAVEYGWLVGGKWTGQGVDI